LAGEPPARYDDGDGGCGKRMRMADFRMSDFGFATEVGSPDPALYRESGDLILHPDALGA
jgi:hypothetical protein